MRERYCGRILTGDFPSNLKRFVARVVARLRLLEQMEGPWMPYLAAWQPPVEEIWHEYSPPALVALLGCPADAVAAGLRQRVVDRRVYRWSEGQTAVSKDVQPRDRLSDGRHILRAQALAQGAEEAVYRLALDDGRHVWLKDQARLITFPEHGVCLSLGSLTDVTKEMRAEERCEMLIAELQAALGKVRTLSGLLPICSACKRIRDDQGYWKQIEVYIRSHSEAEFSHGLCPECARRLYPDLIPDTAI
jgi:hypothetical protein